MKCKCGMEYKTEHNDICPRCGAEPASQSELIEALGVEPFDKDAYLKQLEPLTASTLRLMVADLTEILLAADMQHTASQSELIEPLDYT